MDETQDVSSVGSVTSSRSSKYIKVLTTNKYRLKAKKRLIFVLN